MFSPEKAGVGHDRLFVHRPEKRPGADLSLFQAKHGGAGVERNGVIQHQPIDPKHVVRVIGVDQGPLRADKAGEKLFVALPHMPLAFDGLVQALQLRQAQRRLDIGNAHVPSVMMMDKALLGKTKVAQRPAALGQGVAVHGDQPALAHGDMLVGVETENADVAEPAAGTPAIGLADGLGRVFDQQQILVAAQGLDRGHVHGQPINMNRHDGPAAGGNLGGDLIRVHGPGMGVAVHQHGNGARPQDRLQARDYGEGRQDHLVARPQPQGVNRKLKRIRAVADADPVPAAYAGGERFLETTDKRAFRRNPARVDALVEVFALVAPQQGIVDGNKRLTQGGISGG